MTVEIVNFTYFLKKICEDLELVRCVRVNKFENCILLRMVTAGPRRLLGLEFWHSKW